MQYFHAFWVGGLICAIAQILIDKTKLTPGRILVLFVVTAPYWARSACMIPWCVLPAPVPACRLWALATSWRRASSRALRSTGCWESSRAGTEAAAGGIGASILFGFLAALIFKPKVKS